MHGYFSYDFKSNCLYYQALDDCYYNNTLLSIESEKVKVNLFDRLSFNCGFTHSPHTFILIFPNIEKLLAETEKINKEANISAYSNSGFADTGNALRNAANSKIPSKTITTLLFLLLLY